ncbi:MAG: hypothetical protein J6W24_00075 [Prevotella sp.]|nr:hypothetical protein [Prevotella sp.]
MTYIKPEIKEVIITHVLMQAASERLDFPQDAGTQEEEEVSEFDDLL